MFRGTNLAVDTIWMSVPSEVALWWQGSGGMGLLGLAPLLLIFAVFYLLLILPQQREQK